MRHKLHYIMWPIAIVSVLLVTFLPAQAEEKKQDKDLIEDAKKDAITIEGHTPGWISIYDEKSMQRMTINAMHIEVFYETGKEEVTIRTTMRTVVVKLTYDRFLKHIPDTVKSGY